MTNPRKFPCPYCKGEGSWIEVVLEETGQGPEYDCGWCKGDGMIVIGGPIHQEMKRLKQEMSQMEKEK